MRPFQRGFTLVEILIVMTIMGIVALLALPKLSTAMSQSALLSAQREVAAYLSRAKAVAIQNGRRTNFVRTGNAITINLDNGDGTTTSIGTRDLGAAHDVSVSTSGRDTIQFDPRGFVVVGNTAVRSIYVSRDGSTDTVCVIGLGKISTKKCTFTP